MTKDIINNVDWQRPDKTPPYESQFFVAVKYPNGLGTYDLLSWDGKAWQFDYTGEVVGWVTLQDFMNTIKAGWPEWDATDLSNAKDPGEPDEIVEV